MPKLIARNLKWWFILLAVGGCILLLAGPTVLISQFVPRRYEDVATVSWKSSVALKKETVIRVLDSQKRPVGGIEVGLESTDGVVTSITNADGIAVIAGERDVVGLFLRKDKLLEWPLILPLDTSNRVEFTISER